MICISIFWNILNIFYHYATPLSALLLARILSYFYILFTFVILSFEFIALTVQFFLKAGHSCVYNILRPDNFLI